MSPVVSLAEQVSSKSTTSRLTQRLGGLKGCGRAGGRRAGGRERRGKRGRAGWQQEE